MNQTVTQQDEMGCGAACVAFVIGTSYKKAASLLGRDKAQTTGFQLKELRLTLAEYGHSYRQKHVNLAPKTAIYRDGSIVFITRSKRYPYGHYLVRHRGSWMDPWINLAENKNVQHATSGYRRRLPDKAQWVLFQEIKK